MWILEDNNVTHVPGKCICFIYMKDAKFRNNDALFPSELHVVIQSLLEEPKLRKHNKPKMQNVYYYQPFLNITL